MPGLFYRPLGRREFLRLSSRTVLGSALALSTLTPRTLQADSSAALRLALLSDTHVAADPKNENRKFLPWDNLQKAVSEVSAIGPDAVLLNGDAARLTGEVEDYQAVRSLLQPLAEKCPVCIGMGNHDNRENFLKVFTESPAVKAKVAEKHVLILEQPVLRVILLDSLFYVNKVAGLLGKGQRDWLDKHLASSDSRPTVIFVHHTLGDGDGELLDADALLRVARPYPKVKAIFYGHSHEYSYKQDHGIHLVNLPAVGYNFSDKEPVGWVDARFTATGADLTLKAFGGNLAQNGRTTSLAWRQV